MTFADAGNRRHDLARRAVTALEGILFEERGLDRMERPVPRETLDRRDLAAFDLGGEGQASEHAPAIDMQGASATLTLIAAFLGAGEAHMLTQGVEQRHARLERKPVVLAIDLEIYD